MRKRTVFHARGAAAAQRPRAGRGLLTAASPMETALAYNAQRRLWLPCSRARLHDRHT
jgi:hypothetical protein